MEKANAKVRQDRALKSTFRQVMKRLDYDQSEVEFLRPLDIEDWPEHALDCFLDWGLIKVGPLASSVLCMECEMLCTMPVEIVEKQEGAVEYFLYCGPRNYGKINLKEDNLKQWRLDLSSFSKRLVGLLETESEAEERLPRRLWSLGEKKIKGMRHELFLVRGLTWKDFPDLMDSQKLGKGLPVLFFSLTEVPQNFGYSVFPLDKALIFEKMALSFDLAAVERSQAEQENFLKSEYYFQKQGDTWFICYERQCERIKHSLGLEYLAALLSKPNENLSAFDLYQFVNKGSVENKKQSLNKHSFQPCLDEKAKSEYKTQIKAFDEKIEAAQEINDQDTVNKLTHQKSMLLRELSPKANFRPPEEEKVRQSVSANIRGALKKISEKIPGLSLYLENSIKTGASCAYKPATKLDWKL